MQQKRNTKQKEAIFSQLRSRRDHPSATRLYEDLREDYPALSKATVFRVLKKAAEDGEIMRIHLGSEDRFDGAQEDHCHLICTACSRIVDMPFPAVALQGMEEETGYRISTHHLEFFGLCPHCQK